MRGIIVVVSSALLLVSCFAQDYAEYARGAGNNIYTLSSLSPLFHVQYSFSGMQKKNNRGVLVASALSAVFGGVVGNWMSSRKLKKKFDKEKRDLLQVNLPLLSVLLSGFHHLICMHIL